MLKYFIYSGISVIVKLLIYVLWTICHYKNDHMDKHACGGYVYVCTCMYKNYNSFIFELYNALICLCINMYVY